MSRADRFMCAGLALVLVSGLLRLTLVQSPVMLIPAFAGLLVCLFAVATD